jgi:hypothetical protein
MSPECFHEGDHARTTLDPAPDTCYKPSITLEDPVHLAQRGNPIGELLDPLLAEHYVEGAVRQRDLQGTCLQPLDGRALCGEVACHRQHRRVDVQAHHPSTTPDSRSGKTRHHTGAAGDVEDVLAGAYVSEIE